MFWWFLGTILGTSFRASLRAIFCGYFWDTLDTFRSYFISAIFMIGYLRSCLSFFKGLFWPTYLTLKWTLFMNVFFAYFFVSTFRATYTEWEATTKLVLVSKFGNSDKFGVSCRFQLQMKWMERRARDLVRLNIWCKNKVDGPILGTYKLNFYGIFKIANFVCNAS